MWAWKADGARVNGRRKEIHRRGFPTQRKAQEARAEFLSRQGLGVKFDDKESTGDFLLVNLAAKKKTLKPTSWHMYSEYVHKSLIPAIGSIPLQSLRHEHVQQMVDDLTAAGRGATTVRRIVATLSSGLSDAVRERRLTHNVAEHVRLPKVQRSEPVVWTAAQAVHFLAAVADDPLAPLFEVLIGTGLRRGECLALRWPSLDIAARTLVVDPKRGTLSDVAGTLQFTAPKTTGSAAGVGLSARVVTALIRQAERQQLDRLQWGTAYEDDQLVFCQENGTPLRPEYVLRRFHELSDAAGLPRVKLHSLRHLAATLMIGSGVPFAVASKVLRHSQVGDHQRPLRPPHPRGVARRGRRPRCGPRRRCGRTAERAENDRCDHSATTNRACQTF